MKLSASQAAKETGKSVPTITRAIKSGKISAENQKNGGYLIEASELFRIFPPLTHSSDVTPKMLGFETPIVTGVLEAKLEAREREIALLMSERNDLRNRLDTEAEERRKLTLMLTDMRAKATEKPIERHKGFWAGLLGKVR
jgi:hypothetical protein